MSEENRIIANQICKTVKELMPLLLKLYASSDYYLSEGIGCTDISILDDVIGLKNRLTEKFEK